MNPYTKHLGILPYKFEKTSLMLENDIVMV